jgi:hypothetical protein
MSEHAETGSFLSKTQLESEMEKALREAPVELIGLYMSPSDLSPSELQILEQRLWKGSLL